MTAFRSIKEEREDLYTKLKDCFDFLASTIVDEIVPIVIRIRAAVVLCNTARITRLFLLDEERLGELEKKVKAMEKTLGI